MLTIEDFARFLLLNPWLDEVNPFLLTYQLFLLIDEGFFLTAIVSSFSAEIKTISDNVPWFFFSIVSFLFTLGVTTTFVSLLSLLSTIPLFFYDRVIRGKIFIEKIDDLWHTSTRINRIVKSVERIESFTSCHCQLREQSICQTITSGKREEEENTAAWACLLCFFLSFFPLISKYCWWGG